MEYKKKTDWVCNCCGKVNDVYARICSSCHQIKEENMGYTDWKLTSEEEEKCRLKRISFGKAQAVKKQAYLDAGSVILNPDALEDLYEALKVASTRIHNSIRYEPAGEYRVMMQRDLAQILKALAKAKGGQ